MKIMGGEMYLNLKLSRDYPYVPFIELSSYEFCQFWPNFPFNFKDKEKALNFRKKKIHMIGAARKMESLRCNDSKSSFYLVKNFILQSQVFIINVLRICFKKQ